MSRILSRFPFIVMLTRSMTQAMPRYGRAKRVEGSWPPPPRASRPHPDADRSTRRMPFEQLRGLVGSLIEPEPEPEPEPGAEADPVREFETQQTHCRGPRTSTIDQLIEFLRKQ